MDRAVPARVRTARRNDRIMGVVLGILGIGMLLGGFFMDRLEVRHIHPASIPGLVPMLLGATLALCAAILYARAGSGVVESSTEQELLDSSDEEQSPGRLIAAALWSTIYAIGLVGTLPFTLATAIYVGGFAAGFGWKDADTTRERISLLLKAAAIAIVSSWAIATLFSDMFLVRLP